VSRPAQVLRKQRIRGALEQTLEGRVKEEVGEAQPNTGGEDKNIQKIKYQINTHI